MNRIILSSFLVLLLSPTPIFAQRDSLRNVFLNAESWFLFEEYADALPLYESLLKSDPGNDNLKYKIGICLLNDPYQKDKAIQYLLDASNNINPAWKDNSLKERTAPPDALYYLGNAYLVNELLDRAIESYEEFLEIMDQDVYDDELVKAQIQSCKNAKRLLKMPVDIDLFLLDSVINTRYPDIHPVISGDGTKLAFVSELPFYDGAYYSEKTPDGWSSPRIITQRMGFDADVYPVALSYDGSEMILYYDDDYIGNLYYSRLEDGQWTPATKLGEPISTKYWESHASFSKDGQTLYFTSNRKGTSGGLDIYVSERQPDGKWGPPVNMGTTINTIYNEECPYISEDGQTLYFSSYGHYNMGGYDIFYSRKKEDGSWAEPVNMGYPINTTDDDLFFQPIENGNAAYYSVYSPRGMGRHDIYYMNIYSADNPRLYSVSGNLRTEDGGIDTSPLVIYVTDSESGDTLIYTSPTEEGSFAFQLKQGNYELHFKGEGYEDLIRPLQITASSNILGIPLEDNIELALIQEEIPEDKVELFEGKESYIKLKESRVEAEAGVPLIVPLTAPRGRIIIVKTYQDSVLVLTDTIVTEKRRTDLEILPLTGKSEVELEMIDEDGNLHRNRIQVTGIIPLVKESMEEPVAGDQDIQEAGPLEAEQNIDEDGGDAGLLLQELTELSGEDLLEYLKQLDLEALDLEKEGTYTIEQLKEAISRELELEGFSEKEIEQILSELSGVKSRIAWAPLVLIFVAGAVLIWFIIAWWKRRGKGEEQGE